MAPERNQEQTPQAALEESIMAMEALGEAGPEEYDGQLLMEQYRIAIGAAEQCGQRRVKGFTTKLRTLQFQQQVAVLAHEVATTAGDDDRAMMLADLAYVYGEAIDAMAEQTGPTSARRGPATTSAARTGAKKAPAQ